jgi:hypothetical protein
MALSPDPAFPFLKNLDIPPAWEEAARRFLMATGLTLVLGAPDTGKTLSVNIWSIGPTSPANPWAWWTLTSANPTWVHPAL